MLLRFLNVKCGYRHHSRHRLTSVHTNALRHSHFPPLALPIVKFPQGGIGRLINDLHSLELLNVLLHLLARRVDVTSATRLVIAKSVDNEQIYQHSFPIAAHHF